MGICEAKVASRTEEQALGLGLLLSSPSSSSAPAPADAPAAMESLTAQLGSLDLAEEPEAKSEGNGAAGEGTVWGGTGWNIEPSGWGDDDDQFEKNLAKSEGNGAAGEDTGWGGTGWNIEPSGWGDEDDQFEKNLVVPLPHEGVKIETVHYPHRPGQPDCVFYQTPGGCRFGVNCKFNHSPKKKRNRGRSKKATEGAELEGKVGTCEVNVVPNEESGLPSSSCSASSTTAAEASVAEFKNIMLEEKLDIKPDRNDNHNYPRTQETSNHKKGSKFSKEGKDNGVCFPVRPDKSDCSHYLRTGNCQFGSNCRFNHTPTRKASKGKEKKTTPEKLGRTDNKNAVKERQNQAHSVKMEQKDHKAFKEWKKETPSSKVGKTEHKADKEKQEHTVSGMMRPAEMEATEGMVTSPEKEKNEFKDNSMQESFTSAEPCEHAYFQEKAEMRPVQLNFLGLPMRPGERECPHYMRTGGCKFASNCRYHHPDPTAVVGQDPQSGYHPGRSEQTPGGSALHMTPWPFPINSSQPVPYFSTGPSYTLGFFPLPHQGFYQNPEWNGYQVPITPWFSPEMNIINAPVSAVSIADATLHQQASSDEYPERPGQPECHFFMKNGECKFKSACRYHHPKSRLHQRA